MDGYYASGVSCFPDIEWKLIAKTVINSDVIFLQATGDADGAPGRAALFHNPLGEMQESEGHAVSK